MKVVMVVGPTASGKSKLGLMLAEKFGGVILNADSVQVYRPLVIGSAAPTDDERARVPHYLFQEVDPPCRMTAGEYSRRAHNLLKTLAGQHVPVVFVVGGTGFYLLALENGMLPIQKADPELQKQIEIELRSEGGAEALYAELESREPLGIVKFSMNDHYRLVRAIEVLRRTGRTMTEMVQEHKAQGSTFPYPLLKIGAHVEKERLSQRILERTRLMLQQGLLQETQTLIEKGFAEWEPLSSVGYKEAREHLKTPEREDLDELTKKICQSTRQLAKRQRTWFRRDSEIIWGDPEDPDFFYSRVQTFLNS